MFDFFSRIAPIEMSVSALALGALWFGLNHAVIAPEIGERLAVKRDIPACIARTEDAALAEVEQIELARDRIRAEQERIIAAARGRAQTRLNQFLILHGALDLLSESAIGDLLEGIAPADPLDGGLPAQIRALLPQIPTFDPASLPLPELPRPLPLPSAETLGTQCGCAVATALETTRIERAAWTASLTLWRPDAITRFGEIVSREAGSPACRPDPNG